MHCQHSDYERGVIDDGTAIGMGLATAVNRLKDSKALSKVIILLTDGVNNAGFVDPTTAAGLALKNFLDKTYTIGLGSNGNAMAPIAMKRDGSFRYGLTRVEIDEDLLKSIAEQWVLRLSGFMIVALASSNSQCVEPNQNNDIVISIDRVL